MAHLWIEQLNGDILWGLASLDGGGAAFALSDDVERPVQVGSGDGHVGALACIRRVTDPQGAERWRLYASPESALQVNGLPLLIGMRVLRDKNKIHVGASPAMFFSTERPARVMPFVDQGRPVKCPRCRRTIAVGEPVVRCPNPACGAWHHQDADGSFECWTYDDQCGAGCNWPTDLDGGFQWTPHNA